MVAEQELFDRRCYILGAGFSHACGLPLAKDLTRAVIESRWHPSEYNSAIQRLQFFFPLTDEKRLPDFEQLLTHLNEFRSFEQDYCQAAETRTTDESLTTLQDTLIRGLFGVLAKGSTKVEEASSQVLKQFTKNTIEARAKIVTFNWDCLLETACTELGKGFTYKEPCYGPHPDALSRLHLFKPHGSINLIEATEQTIREYRENELAVSGFPFEKVEESHERIVLQTKDPRSDRRDTLYKFPTQYWLVVPPSGLKSYRSPWIKKQWKLAYDALRSAREITVIGYSLPEFDIRSRLLFRLAIVHRHEAAIPPVRIVDPNPGSVAQRIHECGYPRIECIAKPWQEWFANSAINKEY